MGIVWSAWAGRWVYPPFAGVHDVLSVSHRGCPVEALSKCVFDQGSRRSMMTANPTVDITQQLLPLFDGDAVLQDPDVASLVELALNNDEGLGATREPPSLRFILFTPKFGKKNARPRSFHDCVIKESIA